MKPNTSYGLRQPTDAEMRGAFGSLARCVQITGCDLPTIMFYLNNEGLIAAAAPVPRVSQGDAWSDGLWDRAIAERAETAWLEQGDKSTIKRTAEKIGVCRDVARKALVAAGRWSA